MKKLTLCRKITLIADEWATMTALDYSDLPKLQSDMKKIMKYVEEIEVTK